MEQADKHTNEMEDAAMFFANVFGGERFKDYVRFPVPPGFICRSSQSMLDRGNFIDERNDLRGTNSGD